MLVISLDNGQKDSLLGFVRSESVEEHRHLLCGRKRIAAAGKTTIMIGDAKSETVEIANKDVPIANRTSRFRAVGILISAILLAACALKVQQLSTEPVEYKGFLSYRPFLILEAEIELFLGLWLLSGLSKRLVWGLTTICFVVFSLVAVYKAYTGETSCGCFGKLQINPWYTLILDICVIALLLKFRPDLKQPQPASRPALKFAIFSFAMLAAGIPSGLAMAMYTPATLSDDGAIVGTQRVVLLEPAKWLGKRFSLQCYVEFGGDLAKGKWNMILYHHDCPDCQTRLPALLANAKSLARMPNHPRTVFVEMPPYDPSTKNLVAADPAYELGKLSSVRDWFASTPVTVELAGGFVMKVQERDSTPLVATTIDRSSATQPVPIASTALSFVQDLGLVDPGSRHEVTFDVANPSDRPLIVTSVKSECNHCTVAESPKSIPARGTVTAKVDFHAPTEPTMYSKRVLLTTSDVKGAVIVLQLRACVGLPLEAKNLDCGKIKLGQTGQFQLVLANRGKTPVRPIYAISSLDNVVAQIPRMVIPSGGNGSIPIIVKTEGLTARKARATISLQTDCPTQPKIDVPVTFEVVSDIQK